MDSIAFQSGVTVTAPLDRLSRFLEEEYLWYDSFVDASPNAVIPLDVLVAVGLNAFVGSANVAKLRTIQRGMAQVCDPLLSQISVDEDITTMSDLSPLVDIVVASTYVRGALSAVVTKVLHRKRRRLIPILDTVMVKQYCSQREANVLADSYVSEAKLRVALHSVLSTIQADLVDATTSLNSLATSLNSDGWSMTSLRIHDILVWTEKETRGYYRTS